MSPTKTDYSPTKRMGGGWICFSLACLAAVAFATGCCGGKRWHGRMMFMKHAMKRGWGKGCSKRGRRGWRGKKHRMGKLLCPKKILKCHKCLGLSKEQVTALHGLAEQCKAIKTEFLLAKMRIKVRMMVQWLEDQPDGAKLAALQQQKIALKTKKMKKKLALHLATRKVLTTAQWHKLLVKKLGGGCCGGKCGGKGRWRGRHGKGWKGGGHGPHGGAPCEACKKGKPGGGHL